MKGLKNKNDEMSETLLYEAIDCAGLGGASAEVKFAEVNFFDEIESTNNYLLMSAGNAQGNQGTQDRGGFKLCVAKTQKHGRGQYGRVWVSPPGGIYLSLSRAVEASAGMQGRVSTLGARLAMNLVSGLREIKADVTLKPPNDILCDAGKLAGILVETTNTLCVAGVGLNVYRPERAEDAYKSAAYLNEVVKDCPPMTSLVALVLKCGIQSFNEVLGELFDSAQVKKA